MISTPLLASETLNLPVWSGTPELTVNSQACSTESDLIRRVLDGEVGTFYLLIKPCEQSLFCMALSLLGNRADAEDAVQEAALKAFKSLASFRRESRFSTWLTQITLNEAKATLRRKRRHSFLSVETEDGSAGNSKPAFDIADCRAIPLESLLRKESNLLLEKALSALPPGYHAVIKLRDIEGLNTEETARLLGLTEANVKTRLRRARLQMRSALKQ